MLTKRKKLNIIKETALHDKDTGSPEVQISLLTKRIEELTDHLKAHGKDKHSRRGLLQMVANRQTHMNYLQKKNTRRFNGLMKKLDLKKRAV
jgi:small subunit ribosomal protein S15